MFRSELRLAAGLILATLAITPGLAAATDNPAAGSAAQASPTPAAPVAITPQLAAIEEVLQAEHIQVSEFTVRLGAVTTDEEALALHRAIEQAKMDAQLRILGIQADYARKEGRLDTAAELDAAIAAMGRVDVPSIVEERPVPSSAAAGR